MRISQSYKTLLPRMLAVIIVTGLLFTLAPIQALAATTNISPAAKVSFTFDDGVASSYTQAAPTLAKYGLGGTVYVSTGCVGMTQVPNTCRANTDTPYMTWEQLTQLRDAYGWEIGAHTVNHVCLASTGDGSDCQTDELSTAEVDYELSQSKADLASHGFNAVSYASPYGDYNPATLAQIAKYYTSQRGFADVGYNSWPNSDYYLKVQQVQAGVSVNTVKSYIDSAAANNQWLILVFHDVKTNASNDPDDYEYRTAELDEIAAYAKSRQDAGAIRSVNVGQAQVTSDVNLLPNGSFNNGIANGWTTDSAATITKDTASKGSYPDATNSVRLVSTTREAHLFSPKVSVSPNMPYMFKTFLNVQRRTSGEVGFYIDEYNANGAWISGQYKKAEASVFVEQLNLPYTPSSGAVAQASLQVLVSANSGITAYVDNVQLFPLTSDPVVVPPEPPAPVDVMTNGTFDAGIAGGWTTDSPTNITKDATNNGSPANKLNSLKFVASTTKNAHLFSPKIDVDSTKSYNLSSYLNIRQRRSGSIGFYIDEYDANGNWVSGQYKLGVTARGVTNVGFQYQPSSANVKRASLQVIVVRNSGIQAYFDDVKWFAN